MANGATVVRLPLMLATDRASLALYSNAGISAALKTSLAFLREYRRDHPRPLVLVTAPKERGHPGPDAAELKRRERNLASNRALMEVSKSNDVIEQMPASSLCAKFLSHRPHAGRQHRGCWISP